MRSPSTTVRIGTAGWAVPAAAVGPCDAFARAESALQRYGRVFDASEINTSFYRSHRASTWQRWADSVPAEFRFSVKVPKAITHEARLEPGASMVLVDRFLAEARLLGERLGPLLVQLPPSLAFDPATAEGFLGLVRGRHAGPVAFEPRHASWFTPEAEQLLVDHHVARVAADPPVAGAVAAPGGWQGLRYWRLHGSPRTYYSSYADDVIERLAADVTVAPGTETAETWCVFDNTASGAAFGNARSLRASVARRASVDDVSP